MFDDLIRAFSTNLLSPAILFFGLGVLSAVLKSDLKLPDALYTSLTIYLLLAIGFKGGAAIREAGVGVIIIPALAAILLGALIPLWIYPLLRAWGGLRSIDAAAMAAHYGSVSVVTFIAATNYLKAMHVPYENYMTAILAVMEAPAIIVAVMLGKRAIEKTPSGGNLKEGLVEGSKENSTEKHHSKELWREVFFGKSVFLLMGGLLIGAFSGRAGMEKMEAFFVTPFQGILALFLLEMGIVTGGKLGDLRKTGLFLLGFGLIVPLLHGMIGVLIGKGLGLSIGGVTLMGVLAASASYIAAPAAIRLSLPQANLTLSLTSSLAITFPFNITIGIPIYYAIAKALMER